jgi:hypothetical protein
MFFNNAMKRLLVMVCIITGAGMAAVEMSTKDENTSLKMYGDAGLQTGQAFKYFYKDYREYNHQWVQQSLLHLGIHAAYGSNLEVKLGVEGRLWFSLPDQSGKTTGQAYALYDKIFSYTIYEACGSYLLGDTGSFHGSITTGFFRYKYNPEVRNLGEYLFRSYAYPGVVVNYFDMTDARLTGLKVSGDLPVGDLLHLHADGMLTFETEFYPFFDATPSLIGNCTVAKALDVSLGVSFSRLFPVNDSLTTPKTDPKSRYITKDNDTGYYTYAGTKCMVRLSFDPKCFFPSDMFGPSDLKIYGEAAILGVESYPANDTLNSPMTGNYNIWGYDTLLNKIPVMFGFNVPCCNILDVCALEFEYYRCRYPMNLANAVRLGSQYAYPIPAEYNKPLWYYNSDNWKWSVYAKKTFLQNRIGLVLQFARDHMRFQHILDEPKVYEEALVRPNHWWWTSKVYWAF